MSIVNSTVARNSTIFSGGGIWNNPGASMMIMNSTISENTTTDFGGGIFNGGTLAITNSTLSGNSTGVAGGAILNGVDGTLTITRSTLVGNSSTDGTGGISNSGALTVSHSIFANPAGGNLGSVISPVRTTSDGHNLFSDRPEAPLDSTDRVNTDPLLGPLADHGGPTFTHALLPGSPAIDAGIAVAGLTADQRGIPRPRGFAPDIGAFEFAVPFAATLSAVTGTAGVPVTATFATFTAASAAATAADFRATVDFGDGRSVPGVIARGPDGTFTVAAEHAYPSPGAYRFTVTLTEVALIGPGPGGTRATATGLAEVIPPVVVPPPVPPPPVPPPVAIAPTVLSLRRFGFHARPTALVLTFNTSLDATRAQDEGSYRLSFGGRHRRAIRLRSARYDASARAVTLEPARRLPLSRTFLLTVEGTPPDGLTSTAGVPLAGGRDGVAGTDYVATVDRAALVRPAAPSAGSRGSTGAARRP